MKKQICEYCLNKFTGNAKSSKVDTKIGESNIIYIEKYYECPNCGEKIYGDMFDYNVKAINDELRKINSLIRISEIKQILNDYSISQKNLSKVLGFSENQISRYLKSGNPSLEHSNILKSILNNPFAFEIYLTNSKDTIDEKAYKKSLSKVNQLW